MSLEQTDVGSVIVCFRGIEFELMDASAELQNKRVAFLKFCEDTLKIMLKRGKSTNCVMVSTLETKNGLVHMRKTERHLVVGSSNARVA